MGRVKPLTLHQDSQLIVYDADCIQQPGAHLFDPGHWQKLQAVSGEAVGRGSALFLDTPFGAAVLRKYLRGGQVARLNREHYLYTGWRRTRPVAEFEMLALLHQEGLPVPSPLAAMSQRRGLFYRGWLITRRIEGAGPLADYLEERSQDAALWRQAGRIIRRFHDRGVVHADLNARNILLDGDGAVYLIDFDRSRIREGDQAAFSANLKRLHRSLEKLWPEAVHERLDRCWRELMEAYGTSRREN